MYTFSVIIPFYNEQKTLEKSVTRLFHIDLFDKGVLVDDNSNDESSNTVQEIKYNYENVEY
tara:strand:- start:191 stop:373 length:183 start_codon:yes stop_codon:yes gene_type:complete